MYQAARRNATGRRNHKVPKPTRGRSQRGEPRSVSRSAGCSGPAFRMRTAPKAGLVETRRRRGACPTGRHAPRLSLAAGISGLGLEISISRKLVKEVEWRSAVREAVNPERGKTRL